MKKLIDGIVEFRSTKRAEYRETFSSLAHRQDPDALFLACADSRVVPNLLASTDPGDLFVVRTVGNMLPPGHPFGVTGSDESEGAAVEFAVQALGVKHIIICGHSNCGAMKALLAGRNIPDCPNLNAWLRHGETAHVRFKAGETLQPTWAPYDQLALLNVLEQLEHTRRYPVVQRALAEGRITLHGWYFDIGHAEVYAYEQEDRRFTLIDEAEAARLAARLPATR